MKFKRGDETDQKQCVALKHEFLRCDDAFHEFASAATILIERGHTRYNAYRAYNSYSRFIQHLYEFLMGAAIREFEDTDYGRVPEIADKYVMFNAQRLVTNKREAILSGRSTDMENHISYYPERIPDDFARQFRIHRNTVSTHVKYQRSELSLTDFYRRNHKFLYMLYVDIKGWWGREKDGFPDLKEITAFSVLLVDDPPPLPDDVDDNA